MKKILIADDIKSLVEREECFFKRSDIKIFTTTSDEETLRIHKTEKVDLIITRLNTIGMNGEALCSLIRDDAELRRVSVIMVCSPETSFVRRESQFKANAFITEPIDPQVLFETSHHLLSIAQREFFRAPISIKVQGEQGNEAFLCLSENISASGMLFGTDRILKRGEIILCSFFLPSSTRIITESEIVRVVEKMADFDTNQYGIRFMNLDIASKSAIGVYVEESLRKRS